MIDQQVDIQTADGRVSTFVTHPERGGPYPLILFYMDAPGIREELRDMARRFATVGYCVMLPNLYYRAGVMELRSEERRVGKSVDVGGRRRTKKRQYNDVSPAEYT